MKMMRLGLVVGCLIAISAAGVCAAEIKISSGGAFIDTVVKPFKDQFEKATGNKLISMEKGFKFGVQALENGEVDVIGGAFSAEDFPKLVKKEGILLKDPAVFKHVVVGQDKVIIAINKANPVETLSKEQLKGIFTGKIANWKDVGGVDGEIIIVWIKFLQAPNDAFVKQILDGEAVTKEILEVNMIGDAKSNVTTTQQAIMIYPSTRKDAALKFPAVPDVIRPTVVMTKGEPTPAVKAFIDMVKTELAKK